MMLRITVHDHPESLTLQLEGRLAGPLVREAEDCLERSRGGQRDRVLRVDLTGVTLVDAAGKVFLAARHAEGAQFIASGCLMRAIVAELAGAPIPDCGKPANVDERKH